MSDPLWITEAEVVAALSLPEAIEALEKGLALEAAGTARNMPKTHQIWGGHHTLHAIGAVVEGANTVGTKTWAHTAGGATDRMAAESADDFAVVGSGKQALTQVVAVAAVRKLKRIRVYSPTAENRLSFIARLEKLFPAITLSEA